MGAEEKINEVLRYWLCYLNNNIEQLIEDLTSQMEILVENNKIKCYNIQRNNDFIIIDFNDTSIKLEL